MAFLNEARRKIRIFMPNNFFQIFQTMATPLPKPIKGQADWREYEAVQLENGVTVLAVHDKESKTTAMSCCVNVGASADPRSLSGLAHFVEHMW